MRRRSCLMVMAALVAVLAASWAAAGPAGATARSGIPATGLALSPATQRHLLALFARHRGLSVVDVAGIAPGAVLGPRAAVAGTG
jgi:hypothetical protein